METEAEVVPEYPASPVGVQTAPEAVSPATVVAIGTSLLPDEGSCAITAMTPNGRTGEQERHTGVRETREEARPGGEEVAPDRGLVVATT